MSITQFRQVCIVTEHFETTLQTLVERYGVGPFKCWDMDDPMLFNQIFYGKATDWAMKLGVAWMGSVQVEVIQPTRDPNLYAIHLGNFGPGLHHLLVEWSGGLVDALERLPDLGYREMQSGQLDIPMRLGPVTLNTPQRLRERFSTRLAYFNTAPALGTVLEVVQMPPAISFERGVQIGKPDFMFPSADPLPTPRLQAITRIGLQVADVSATVAAWTPLLDGWEARDGMARVTRNGVTLEVVQGEPTGLAYLGVQGRDSSLAGDTGLGFRFELDPI